MKTKNSEYVTVSNAAEILGVSQGTVRNWAKAGKNPMLKNSANGYRLFLRADLDPFRDECTKPASHSNLPRLSKSIANTSEAGGRST